MKKYKKVEEKIFFYEMRPQMIGENFFLLYYYNKHSFDEMKWATVTCQKYIKFNQLRKKFIFISFFFFRRLENYCPHNFK